MGTIDTFYRNVLERILKLKQNANLSDAAFEKELKLKPKTVDTWKRGISKSYLKNIDNIAKYFNVSTDYLLGMEDEK